MHKRLETETFLELIQRFWDKGYFLCVGLDPVLEKIPYHMNTEYTLIEFFSRIINATAQWTACYKPNLAFFERCGLSGVSALIEIVRYIHGEYPYIPVILDRKCGDIPNTNEAYAEALLNIHSADAITVNPYLGISSFQPFFSRDADTCLFVLCRTSNPEGAEIQDLLVSYKDNNDEVALEPLYLHIARLVKAQYANGNFGLVVGATCPEELTVVRQIVGDMPILIPGIGAQGGDLKATVKAGRHPKKGAMLINASRSILYASSGNDFERAAEQAAQTLHQQIQDYL